MRLAILARFLVAALCCIALVPRLCLGTHCREALPRACGQSAEPYRGMSRYARQSLAGSAFPGRAWEREYVTQEKPQEKERYETRDSTAPTASASSTWAARSPTS